MVKNNLLDAVRALNHLVEEYDCIDKIQVEGRICYVVNYDG